MAWHEFLQVQRHNAIELLLAINQLARVLLGIVTATPAWADETLCAYSWRAERKGRIAGSVIRPLLDTLFFWQAADPTIVDEQGVPIRSHCNQAFERERRKQYLPPEYREDAK